MELKHSSFYKRRDGQVVRLVRYFPGLKFCWGSDLMDRYLDNGQYDQWKSSHPKDLVEEVDLEGRSLLEVTPDVEKVLATFEMITPAVPIKSEPMVAPVTATTTTQVSRHAHIIAAWANGAPIQCKGPQATEWHDILPPGRSVVQWRDDCEFRIKPAIVKKDIWIGIYKSQFTENTGIYASGGYNQRHFLSITGLIKIKHLVVDNDTGEILEEEWISP